MSTTIQIISLNDAGYPPLLKEIPDPPKQLYVRGKLPPSSSPAIAIVGTRKATSDGKRLAKEIARTLAQKGITIVSGLAFGIDAAAHEGALAAHGNTIAVLGNGIDSIYPKAHESLGNRILNEHGCILSEYPEGTPTLPHQFLARNRIVSGLSSAIVIIEAPIRSGTLVTARHALDQGREVFIIPGSVYSANFKGSHMLLRNGARIVTSAEDILEDLSSEFPALQEKKDAEKSALETIKDPMDRIIFAALKSTAQPISIDNLHEATKLEPNVLNEHLTFLMFEDKVKEQNGKFSII